MYKKIMSSQLEYC